MRIILVFLALLLGNRAQASAIYEWQNIDGSHAGTLEISDAAYAAGHVSFVTPRFIYPTEPYTPGDIVYFQFDVSGFGPSFINGDYDFDLSLTGNGLSGSMSIYGLETTVLMSASTGLWTISQYRTDVFGHCYTPFEDCSGNTGRWNLIGGPAPVHEPSALLLLAPAMLVIVRRWHRASGPTRPASQGRRLLTLAAVSLSLCLYIDRRASATPIGDTFTQIDTSLNEYRPGLENQGWWPPTIGYSNNAESDYHFVGWSTPGYSDTEVRSFFSFYLDPLFFDHSTVTAADFIIRKGDSRGAAPQETLGLFDVTTPLATVMHNVSTQFSVWSDLGGGTSYGTYTFPVGGNPDESLFIPLNSAGVDAINAAIGGYFTMGAALVSGDGIVFLQNPGSLGIQALRLELAPVPEPPIIALFLICLGVVLYHPKHDGRR